MGNSSSQRSLPDGTPSPLTQLINQHIYAKDQLFKMSSSWHEWTKGDLENRWPLGGSLELGPLRCARENILRKRNGATHSRKNSDKFNIHIAVWHSYEQMAKENAIEKTAPEDTPTQPSPYVPSPNNPSTLPTLTAPTYPSLLGDKENYNKTPIAIMETSTSTLETRAQQPDAIPIPRINLNNGETNNTNNLHTGVIAGHTKVDVEEDEVHHSVNLPPATTVVKRAITGTSATNNLRTSILAGHSKGELEEDKNHGKANPHVDLPPATTVVKRAITGTSATNNLRTSILAGHSKGEAEEDKNHGKANHHVDLSPNTAVTEGAPLQEPMPKQIALPGDRQGDVTNVVGYPIARAHAPFNNHQQETWRSQEF
ncbi:unnamed protein product [Arctogadus glacialis]